MTRTMYDAITPSNIPVTAQMVAGYVDGRYAWMAADWARFPHSVKVRIAVFSSTDDGHVLDVEPGCSTPASAPGWVQRRRAHGVDPTVYCSLSQWPVVRAAFAAAHVAEPHWWVAAYPGNGPNLYPGSVAHQWQNPGPVDISVVADYWPGVDPKPVAPRPAPPSPTPAPARPIPLEDVMKPWFFRAKTGAIVIVGPTGVRVLTLPQWVIWHALGYDLAPGMSAMEPGPFQAVIDTLGGVKP